MSSASASSSSASSSSSSTSTPSAGATAPAPPADNAARKAELLAFYKNLTMEMKQDEQNYLVKMTVWKVLKQIMLVELHLKKNLIVVHQYVKVVILNNVYG